MDAGGREAGGVRNWTRQRPSQLDETSGERSPAGREHPYGAATRLGEAGNGKGAGMKLVPFLLFLLPSVGASNSRGECKLDVD